MDIIILHEKNRPQSAKILELGGVPGEIGERDFWRISSKVNIARL